MKKQDRATRELDKLIGMLDAKQARQLKRYIFAMVDERWKK
jgi:hypothetical protein